MQQTSPIPTRITIDFRESILPSRSWILGELPGSIHRRVELISIEDPRSAVATPLTAFEPSAAESSDCGCPDFCERDHANE